MNIKFKEQAASLVDFKWKKFDLYYDDDEAAYTLTGDLELKTKRIICISKIVPEKWKVKPLMSKLAMLTIPVGTSNLSLSLRAGHAGPDNRGQFVVNFEKPVTVKVKRSIEIDEITGATRALFLQLEKLRKSRITNEKRLKLQRELCLPAILTNMTPKTVVSVAGKLKDAQGPLLAKRMKIISSYGKNDLNMRKVPDFVLEFFNTYVAGLNRTEGSRLWKRVKNWYQSLPESVKKSIPKYTYRGMRTDRPQLIKVLDKYKPVGKVVKYKHKGRYPISSSTSAKIAMDYSEFPAVGLDNAAKQVSNVFQRKLILKFAIKPEDVVFDTRLVQKLSYHSAQSEIILDPTKTYKARVRNFDDVKFLQ